MSLEHTRQRHNEEIKVKKRDIEQRWQEIYVVKIVPRSIKRIGGSTFENGE